MWHIYTIGYDLVIYIHMCVCIHMPYIHIVLIHATTQMNPETLKILH